MCIQIISHFICSIYSLLVIIQRHIHSRCVFLVDHLIHLTANLERSFNHGIAFVLSQYYALLQVGRIWMTWFYSSCDFEWCLCWFSRSFNSGDRNGIVRITLWLCFHCIVPTIPPRSPRWFHRSYQVRCRQHFWRHSICRLLDSPKDWLDHLSPLSLMFLFRQSPSI